MTVQAGRAAGSGRRLGDLAAGAALVGLSTLAAHQATYLGATGSAADYAEAMSSTGHDSTWLPLVTIVLLAAVSLAVVAAWRLLRLSRLAGRSPSNDALPGLDAYANVVLGLWSRMAAATFLAYATLENVERALAGLTPPGIDALVVHGPLPVLLILASSLAVAAISGLFRWRTHALIARIASGLTPFRRTSSKRRPVVPERRPARPWAVHQSSRAPPRLLTAS